MEVGGQRHALAALPRDRPGTRCTGGWMYHTADQGRCGKSRHTGIQSPDRSSHSESLYRLSNPGSDLSQCHSKYNYRS
jgi:hypothetical protein